MQTFNGSPGKDRNMVATISRNGDLIHKCYLVVEPIKDNSVNNVADVIKSVELEIGGQQIDKQTGDWMDVWSQLSLPKSKQAGWESMTQRHLPTEEYSWSDTLPPAAENLTLTASGSDNTVYTSTEEYSWSDTLPAADNLTLTASGSDNTVYTSIKE